MKPGIVGKWADESQSFNCSRHAAAQFLKGCRRRQYKGYSGYLVQREDPGVYLISHRGHASTLKLIVTPCRGQG